MQIERLTKTSTPNLLVDPNGTLLTHGTRLRLTKLQLKRAISEERFITSMSRRFAIDQTEMRVYHHNEEPLKRFDMDLEVPLSTRWSCRMDMT